MTSAWRLLSTAGSSSRFFVLVPVIICIAGAYWVHRRNQHQSYYTAIPNFEATTGTGPAVSAPYYSFYNSETGYQSQTPQPQTEQQRPPGTYAALPAQGSVNA
eukprot:TRINITY_DN2375_c0_g1_i2.p2 TRINITY_DN2375_c0_g1~~TRINITY_DN2375_c0_g1_i2.p2  ORF type:complete len:103 (-),score=15.52 TRINITY_DN2375_c0_g1_i2:23-331(-)